MDEETIAAAQANRDFSRLLRGVREGRTFVVTSHGRPVARVEPAGPENAASPRAWDAILSRLRSQAATSIGTWKREELYEDDSV